MSLLKVDRLGWDKNMFRNGFIWKIKDGRNIRFWEDIWYGQKALYQVYPRLFGIYAMKTSSVRLMWEIYHANGGLPSTIWNRQLRSWESDQLVVLNHLLSNVSFGEGKDILYWSWSGKGFTTRDCYMALSNTELESPLCLSFWKLKIPPKVQLFLWKLEHKVLPTKVFLSGRLLNIDLSLICNWCMGREETITHIFLEFDIADWCWTEVCKSWSIPRSFLSASAFSLSAVMDIVTEHETKEA